MSEYEKLKRKQRFNQKQQTGRKKYVPKKTKNNFEEDEKKNTKYKKKWYEYS